MPLSKYTFTQDWFTHNTPKWKKFLLPLQDTELRCLEIGSYEGLSGLWLHDHVLLHPDSSLLMIEIGNSQSALLESNIELCNSDKVDLMYIDSKDILYEPDITSYEYDFIYVDGYHSSQSTLRNMVLCFELLKVGGIMCIDDYLWQQVEKDGTGPKIAMDAFLECYQKYITILDKGYQVWIQKL